MTKPLLIEILVEELPAIPFLKELKNIEKKWADILEQNNLLCEFNFYYTPRRIVFWHREFKLSQDDKELELWGPPKAIAFKDGVATPAANGFAKKCGICVDDLEFNTRNNQEFLYYKKTIKGEESKKLLNSMINELFSKLNFGKSMRWGSRSDSFIRPIRNLAILLGEDIVDAELFGIKSTKSTYPHRMVSYEPFEFEFAGDYFCKLDKNGVILYQDERRKIIVDKIRDIEKEYGVEVELDEELLDEIVAITEYPTALIGSFDEMFLELPPEVIINSMKEHQRYFAVYKDGKLTNKFIVVSNAYTNDFSYIVAGNEKVLRPRLSDAMFFWKNDLKNGLSPEGLKDIVFVDKLGSVYDKSIRELKVVNILSTIVDISNKELLEEAVMLSKADLLTDMVYEFTELQGLMGYYYAKAMGKDELVYTAIKEQYLPTGENSELPSNIFSSIVALSNKIDTILALFSVGMIPSGSKDPFALRRAAMGIFRICYEHKIKLDFVSIANSVKDNYTNLDISQVVEFVNERLYKFYSDINPTVIKAVLSSSKNNDILSSCLKIEALNSIVQSSDFRSLSDTFKRIANIVKDVDLNNLAIDTDLFEQDEEKVLYDAYSAIVSKSYSSFDEQLEALFNLKEDLDRFFDKVFVNHEDENIKRNRKNLIGTIYKEFKQIADIKEITI